MKYVPQVTCFTVKYKFKFCNVFKYRYRCTVDTFIYFSQGDPFSIYKQNTVINYPGYQRFFSRERRTNSARGRATSAKGRHNKQLATRKNVWARALWFTILVELWSFLILLRWNQSQRMSRAVITCNGTWRYNRSGLTTC